MNNVFPWSWVCLDQGVKSVIGKKKDFKKGSLAFD
jgi:hypothetical protein